MSVPLLAVDGGNSKTDVVLLAADGSVLAARRGGTVSHQRLGLARAATALVDLVAETTRSAGLDETPPLASLAVLCLAGVDLPTDERALAATHGGSGLASRVVLENDTLAALRAGSPLPWGVAVVVGAGINGVGIGRDGRRARFAGLGPISGDRGGGDGLGLDALGAAVRARDGRGPRTSLERLVPERFGLRRPIDVTTAVYTGRLAESRVGELAEVAVRAARDGDAVAASLVDALADECASFAIAAIRRLHLGREAVPVVLSGGVARGAGEVLAGRVRERVRKVAERAEVTILEAPPVLGAALLGLDLLHRDGGDDATSRARRAITGELLDPSPTPASPRPAPTAPATGRRRGRSGT